jgi:hypothetical protein
LLGKINREIWEEIAKEYTGCDNDGKNMEKYMYSDHQIDIYVLLSIAGLWLNVYGEKGEFYKNLEAQVTEWEK